MAYKSRFTDKPTKRVSAGQLAQKTKDSYSKAFDKKQREVRRDKQKQELNQFKGELMASDRVLKDSSGNFVYNKNTGEPVYLGSKPVFDTDSSSPTFGQYVSTSVADRSQQLANKYGPTFKEILGDIGGGLGSIFQGFAEKGPPIVQILKGLYQKGKDYFTQPSGIEEAVPQASGGLYNNQPIEAFIPPTFDDQKIRVEQLLPILVDEKLPSEMSNEQFRDTYPFLYDSRLQNLPFKAVPNNVNDQTNFQKALANARVENTGLGLDSLKAAYDFARNPTLNTQYGNFSLDNMITGNPQMNYGNTVMINGVPVDLSASIGQGGISGGLSFAFNKGGSVDKHSGLGYMLK